MLYYALLFLLVATISLTNRNGAAVRTLPAWLGGKITTCSMEFFN